MAISNRGRLAGAKEGCSLIAHVAVLGFALGLLLCGSATAASDAPFVGDFEVEQPGWQQFSALQYEEERPLSDSFALVADPVRQGRSAARFTVRQGYSRFGYGEDTEVVWHSSEKPGDDFWYAWSTLFPEEWGPPYSWGIFAQWHAPLGTSPIIAFNARANTAVLNVRAGLTVEARNSSKLRRSVRILSTLAKGRWNDFVMHVRWSTQKDGAIEVYHRVAGGARLDLVASLQGIPTFQQTAEGDGVGAFLLLGLYRGSLCPQPTTIDCNGAAGNQASSVIYQDGFVRAPSFAAAVTRAFPGRTVLPQPIRVRRSTQRPTGQQNGLSRPRALVGWGAQPARALPALIVLAAAGLTGALILRRRAERR